MRIRIANIEDAEASLAFLRNFRHEGLNTVLMHEGVPDLDAQKSFISNLDGTNGVMIIAEDKDEVIGSLTAERKRHPQLKHACEFGIGVLESYRNKGVGTRLIERLFDWAKECGINRIELSVFGNNEEAIRLYERIGFMGEGRKIGAVIVDGVPADIVEMASILSPKI